MLKMFMKNRSTYRKVHVILFDVSVAFFLFCKCQHRIVAVLSIVQSKIILLPSILMFQERLETTRVVVNNINNKNTEKL